MCKQEPHFSAESCTVYLLNCEKDVTTFGRQVSQKEHADQYASQTATVRPSVPEEAAEDAALAEALCVAVGEAAGAPVAAAARPAVTEATAQPRLPLLGHGSIVSREWKARKNLAYNSNGNGPLPDSKVRSERLAVEASPS